jgi:hypothetical protein
MRLIAKLLIATVPLALAQETPNQTPNLFSSALVEKPLVRTGVQCSVPDFYAIASINHDPTERHTLLLNWLSKNGKRCSSYDLTVIWNSLAAWAGTSDTPQIRAAVVKYYEDALIREKK